MDDFDGVQRHAVEEIVRYASPVMFMRRTVTQDGATLSGHEFKEGDKLLMYYISGNRDEDVFDDPYAFNVKREPNNHIGFGGPGPHFCLGANLARQEIKVMFKDLFQFLPDIEMSGERAAPVLELHQRHQAHAGEVLAPKSRLAQAGLNKRGLARSKYSKSLTSARNPANTSWCSGGSSLLSPSRAAASDTKYEVVTSRPSSV